MKLPRLLQLISIVFLMSGICSCVTEKRCNERFPPQNSSNTINFDSVHKLDSVYFTKKALLLPARVIEKHISFPCPEVEYHSEEKNGNITQTIDISKGVIKAKCKEDELRDSIDVLNHLVIKSRTKNSDKKNVETIVVEKYKEHWYHLPLIWYFPISFSLILGWLYIKLKP